MLWVWIASGYMAMASAVMYLRRVVLASDDGPADLILSGLAWPLYCAYLTIDGNAWPGETAEKMCYTLLAA